MHYLLGKRLVILCLLKSLKTTMISSNGGIIKKEMETFGDTCMESFGMLY